MLDEPSNSLDIHAKQQLLHWISRTRQCVIIVSHDRTLLDQMDHIIEITHLGIVHYGGNYNTLARFAFRNRDTLKIVSELSGGERVRAGLAVSLSAEHPLC